ncbi:MAG: hypothetical protein NVS4B3_27280 [Gemmatimonadaceae bacterium]
MVTTVPSTPTLPSTPSLTGLAGGSRFPCGTPSAKCGKRLSQRERMLAMAQPFRPVWKLQVGEEAPDFELDATGDAAGKGGPSRKIKLSEYRGQKNVVLAFYPAAFTRV